MSLPPYGSAYGYFPEEKARRQREREEKLPKGNTQIFGFLVVVLFVSLFIYLVFSYYGGNIVSSDPVQEKSVNLLTQTDQRHEIKQCDQSEQTGREQQKDSQQTGGEQQKNSQQTGGEQQKDSQQTGGEQQKNSQQAEQTDQGDEDKERYQEEEKTNQTPPGTIRLALLNTRAMNKKTSRISELITQNNLDVLLTTETWLRDNNADIRLREASPQSFSFHSQVRDDGRRGGGVAIQFSEALRGERIHFDSLNIETFEFVVTVLHHNDWDQPLVIINLYHPPGYNQQRFRRFLDEFQSLLDEVRADYSSIIVTGDFNIHVNNERRSYTDEFDSLLLINNLEQHVEEPTHQRGNTLDLVITTNVEVSGLFVQNDGVSDHSTVYFNAKPKDTRKKTEENKDEERKRFKRTEE